MDNQGIPRAIELLCQRDTRYPPMAYQFLREGLDLTVRQTGREGQPAGSRHVTGAELCDGLRQHAIAEYGPLARTVLASWGITTTGDFGNLVFNLVESGLLGKSDNDSPDDFINVFSYDDAFTQPFRAKHPWTPKSE